jgi:hypothetical protein
LGWHVAQEDYGDPLGSPGLNAALNIDFCRPDAAVDFDHWT